MKKSELKALIREVIEEMSDINTYVVNIGFTDVYDRFGNGDVDIEVSAKNNHDAEIKALEEFWKNHDIERINVIDVNVETKKSIKEVGNKNPNFVQWNLIDRAIKLFKSGHSYEDAHKWFDKHFPYTPKENKIALDYAANKKETPELKEDGFGYMEHRYSNPEISALKYMGFHWVPKDKEWFNDSRGREELSVYKDADDNRFVLRTTGYDEDGQFKEEYEHFKDIQELEEYLG